MDDRREPPRASSERESLAAFLDYQRETLAWKCAGLDPDQLRERAIPPSELSLLGLVRHLADVEAGWFRHGINGEERSPHFSTDADPDADFLGVGGADVDVAFAVWRDECERARVIVAGRSLDHTFTNRNGTAISVRWVLLHMIEEYARHNGHADLLRERLDGATGE